MDADGEIKRVTYTASNGTGFKATTVSPLQEHVTAVQSRVNRTTSTTRKPSVVYATSSETSTKSSVVQSIPRTRKTTTTPQTPSSTTGGTTSTSSTESTTRPGLSQFRTTTRTRPRFVINGQQRPPVLEEESGIEGDSQIKKPEERVSNFRKIIFAKRPVDVTLRPITEEFEEKEEEDKITTGNTLRRQLHEETTKSVPVINVEHHHEDDHGDHVYGGALSTSRPLFTTSNPPRVIQRVATLRPERAKTLYVNNRETIAPARFEPPRAYESDPKAQEERENAAALQQQVLIGPPRDQVRDYQQNPEQPIYVRQQDGYSRALPPGGILVRGPAPENLLEDDPAGYRTPLPANRVLYRPLANQQPIYSTTTEPNVHYLTEQPIEDPRIPINPDYVRRDRIYRPIPPYPEQDPRARPVMLQPVRPIPRPSARPVDDRDYQGLSPDGYQYSGPIALPPEHPNPIAPPLSRRDFQMLLRRLLVSQYGVQALTYPKTYLEDALYDQQPYPSYQPSYRASPPRQDIGFEPRYGDRVPLVRAATSGATSANGYSRSMAPVYQPMRYDDYQDGRAYPKRVYRQKFYAPEETEDGDEILPAPIREALLLRMLQLAINADRPPMTMAMPMTTSSTVSRYRKMGPVRSVQIITDDSEEEKEARKKG